MSGESHEETEEAGFLSRWSDRKRQDQRTSVNSSSQAPQGPEASPGDTTETESAPTQADAELTLRETPVHDGTNDAALADAAPPLPLEESAEDAEEPLLSDADMPPLETLTAESDISGFFNKGVSDTLRKAALRHVFQFPVYNIRDGLNDYDEDYTVFEPLGDIVTSDMKFHAERKRRLAEEEEARRLEEEAALAEQQADAGEPDADADESEGEIEDEAELAGEQTGNPDAGVDPESEPLVHADAGTATEQAEPPTATDSDDDGYESVKHSPLAGTTADAQRGGADS